MSSSYFSVCPRCGTKAFEKLRDHAHCIECLYVEDNYFDMETAYHAACRIEKDLPPAQVIKLPQNSKKQKGEAS
jgi:hypothetical protein